MKKSSQHTPLTEYGSMSRMGSCLPHDHVSLDSVRELVVEGLQRAALGKAEVGAYLQSI